MNKRINIKRDTSKEVREFLAEQISKSIIDIRGEYPKEISNIVESIDFSTTQLRELPVIDNLLREKTINY